MLLDCISRKSSFSRSVFTDLIFGFDMDHFTVFIEFITILLLLYVSFVAVVQTQACEILAPQPGVELALPALESEVLTTEAPGKSHISSVKDVVYTILGFVLIFISGSSMMNGLLFLSRSVFHPLLPSSGSRNCVQSCCALWFSDG